MSGSTEAGGGGEDQRPAFRRRRRANVQGGRTGTHKVSTSPAEEALLAQLALAQGVTIPRLLVESALAGDRETAAARRDAIAELFAIRRLLAAVSNNVNQIARHANASEEFPEEASAVLASVRRLVPRVDAAVDLLAEPVRARQILEAGRRRTAAPVEAEEPETDWAAELSESSTIDAADDTAGPVMEP